MSCELMRLASRGHASSFPSTQFCIPPSADETSANGAVLLKNGRALNLMRVIRFSLGRRSD